MNREIKRSKSLRTWYKYKNLIILMAVVLIIAVALIIGIAKAVIGKKGEKQTTTEEVTTTQEETTTEEIVTEPPTEETTEETTEEIQTSATEIVKTPAKEKFDNESFFDDAVFVGDVFVSGLDVYGHIRSSKLEYNEGWTTGKASNSVSKIIAHNASKVFIQLGLNDLNNGKKPESVYDSYKELVDEIKKGLPNAKIYIVSVFPISSGFEAKSTTTVTNEDIQKLNELLSAMEGTTFLNVSASISNSDGTLITDLSSNGYNITNGYYGFILNLIVEMCQ